MKTSLSRFATIILALGLIVPLSRAQAPAIAGPSLQETLNYLNSAIANNQHYRNGQISVSSDHETVLTEGEFFNEGKNEWVQWRDWAKAIDLDTSLIGARYGYIEVSCKKKSPYASEQIGEYRPNTSIGIDLLSFTLDDEKAGRLKKAFTHLLELLQAEYKAKHNDSNDPFK